MKFDRPGEAGEYTEPANKLDPVLHELRRLRYARGISQQVLADRMGCHKKTIGKMERGTVNPHFDLVLSWAEALGAKLEVRDQ